MKFINIYLIKKFANNAIFRVVNPKYQKTDYFIQYLNKKKNFMPITYMQRKIFAITFLLI